jgi:hypothetical protein
MLDAHRREVSDLAALRSDCKKIGSDFDRVIEREREQQAAS